MADAQELEPRSVVEFGSGASSIRLAEAFPHAQVLSIEGDPRYFAQLRDSRDVLERLDGRLRIDLRPVRFQQLAWSIYETYARGWFPDEIDVVLIDGPPHWTKRGREACLYQVAEKLRLGGRVYLDDYARAIEQHVVRNWQRSYPGVFEIRELHVGHGLCVLEKRRPVGRRPKLSLPVAFDALTWHGYRLAEMAWEQLPGTQPPRRRG